MSLEEILAEYERLGSPEGRAGMSRFGIDTGRAYGVSVAESRRLARRIGRDHALALALWQTGRHEPRILATLIADPEQVDEALMERWLAEVTSWDLCDGCCGNLWDRTPQAWDKAREWARREPEFQKRAGFALMASLAVHEKRAADDAFLPFLPAIREGARDGRNFVTKAVDWALRQTGKRNAALHALAVKEAEALAAMDDKPSRRVGRTALRELTSSKVLDRLGAKA